MFTSRLTETDVETTSKADPKIRTRYNARTVLWTAGVEAVPFAAKLAESLGVEQNQSGCIAVQPDLSAPGYPNVWVVGDMASIDDLPGVAEVAMQGGRYEGGVIEARVENADRPAPFHYRDLGSAAYLARGHAIVQAGPIRMSGFLGWLSWGVIHIAFLAGVRNRIGTLTTWAGTSTTNSRRERAITYGEPETARKPYT